MNIGYIPWSKVEDKKDNKTDENELLLLLSIYKIIVYFVQQKDSLHILKLFIWNNKVNQ